MQQKGKNLYLCGSLYRATQLLPPTPRSPPKPERITTSHISDEVILDMRRMHEFENMPLRQVQRRYPQYDNHNYIHKVLQYEIRGKLIPKKEPK